MSEAGKLHEQIKSILKSTDHRQTKAGRLAEVIRLARDYRWVGVYDVDDREIAIIAWSGQGAPAYPRFPVSQGLSGEAVSARSTVISHDVENDPRYLTAFGSTQSEIIVPVIKPSTGAVIGTIDAESEHKNAFTDADRKLLEQCAREMIRLWE